MIVSDEQCLKWKSWSPLRGQNQLQLEAEWNIFQDLKWLTASLGIGS